MADSKDGNSNAEHGQSESYPSPPSYSTTSQINYGHAPQQYTSSIEGYRGGGKDQVAPESSLNLPPIRPIDEQPGHSAVSNEYHQPSAYFTSPSTTSQYPLQPLEHGHGPGQGVIYPPPNPADYPRYRLHDRKEIHRRTKTGCLTCRKRRIKCDEEHPVCRNCQKSKRECAGYDPIFKQQPDPRAGSLESADRIPSPAESSAPAYASYDSPEPSHIPQGYAPALNNMHNPSMQYDSLQSPMPPVDFSSAIDPALAGGDPPGHPGSSIDHDATSLAHGDGQAAEREASEASAGGDQGKQQEVKAKTTAQKVEELYMIGGADPPAPKAPESITPETLDEIKYFYSNEYAKGIDGVLETKWYTQSGLEVLIKDTELCVLSAGMLELFGMTRNYDALRMLPSTEARVIWSLMCLPRKQSQLSQKGQATGQGHNHSSDHELDAVLQRISVFEYLITGDVAAANPVQSTPARTPTREAEFRRDNFWWWLGQFVALGKESMTEEKERALALMRQFLDKMESRDVLYSMAVVRHLHAIMDFPKTAEAGGERNKANQLLVARKLVEDEAAGKGSNQVVQRLCGMAARSWSRRE